MLYYICRGRQRLKNMHVPSALVNRHCSIFMPTCQGRCAPPSAVASLPASGSNDLKICTIFYGGRGFTENSLQSLSGAENPEAEKTEYGTLTGTCRFLSENVECLFASSDKRKGTRQNRVPYSYFPNRSLCVPVLVNVNTSQSFSIR